METDFIIASASLPGDEFIGAISTGIDPDFGSSSYDDRSVYLESREIDFYSLDVAQGETITVNTYGYNSYSDDLDTTVGLYDSSGSRLVFDDDSGSGLNSSLSFVAQSSDTYYVGVGAYGTDSGNYDISINALF